VLYCILTAKAAVLSSPAYRSHQNGSRETASGKLLLTKYFAVDFCSDEKRTKSKINKRKINEHFGFGI